MTKQSTKHLLKGAIHWNTKFKHPDGNSTVLSFVLVDLWGGTGLPADLDNRNRMLHQVFEDIDDREGGGAPLFSAADASFVFGSMRYRVPLGLATSGGDADVEGEMAVVGIPRDGLKGETCQLRLDYFKNMSLGKFEGEVQRTGFRYKLRPNCALVLHQRFCYVFAGCAADSRVASVAARLAVPARPRALSPARLDKRGTPAHGALLRLASCRYRRARWCRIARAVGVCEGKRICAAGAAIQSQIPPPGLEPGSLG